MTGKRSLNFTIFCYKSCKHFLVPISLEQMPSVYHSGGVRSNRDSDFLVLVTARAPGKVIKVFSISQGQSVLSVLWQMEDVCARGTSKTLGSTPWRHEGLLDMQKRQATLYERASLDGKRKVFAAIVKLKE